MKPFRVLPILLVSLATCWAEDAVLPPAFQRDVDFHRDVLPILARRCATCHASGRKEGGFSLETRSTLLRGGDSGAVVTPGEPGRRTSGDSLLVRLVAGVEPDRIMPQQGPRLTQEEVSLLRGWIDQGVAWDNDVSLRKLTLQTWRPREVELPVVGSEDPVDYFTSKANSAGKRDSRTLADDRTWFRRLSLDTVGLLPQVAELEAFVADPDPGKYRVAIRRFLDDKHAYAQHWMSFWNDILRNDYSGTGFIDNGRSQITKWLYGSLIENKPFDRMVFELISAGPGAEGFTKGIIWRGRVNASQRPPLQAAQSISQVFLGLNLKCASCHDSFVSQWTLDDAYALAAVFSDNPLEVFRCDKPTGRVATPGFFNDEIGSVDLSGDKSQRQQELARLLTDDANARLTRTIVNRLWARLIGRGLVEPVDEMDNEPSNPDLLDWLANDLRDHNYDLKRTLAAILDSRLYRSVTSLKDPGPYPKRMTAEQFVDAVWQLTGTGPKTPAKSGRGKKAKAIDVPVPESGAYRASLVNADLLMRSLGRPNREQIVTTRPDQLTTLQALDLTNGTILEETLARGATQMHNELSGRPPRDIARTLYVRTLGREPTLRESQIAVDIVGSPPTSDGIVDLLWTLFMLPEFQLIR